MRLPCKRRVDHWREARPVTIGLATLALIAGVGLVAGEALDPACGETAAAVAGVPAAPTFVGSVACGSCHQGERVAWRGSHHDLAMAEATDASVLGDFGGATFYHGGVTSRFFNRGGKFFVYSDGSDGKLADFEIRYTFGFYPLQQYLISFTDGGDMLVSSSLSANDRARLALGGLPTLPGLKLAQLPFLAFLRGTVFREQALS